MTCFRFLNVLPLDQLPDEECFISILLCDVCVVEFDLLDLLVLVNLTISLHSILSSSLLVSFSILVYPLTSSYHRHCLVGLSHLPRSKHPRHSSYRGSRRSQVSDWFLGYHPQSLATTSTLTSFSSYLQPSTSPPSGPTRTRTERRPLGTRQWVLFSKQARLTSASISKPRPGTQLPEAQAQSPHGSIQLDHLSTCLVHTMIMMTLPWYQTTPLSQSTSLYIDL